MIVEPIQYNCEVFDLLLKKMNTQPRPTEDTAPSFTELDLTSFVYQLRKGENNDYTSYEGFEMDASGSNGVTVDSATGVPAVTAAVTLPEEMEKTKYSILASSIIHTSNGCTYRKEIAPMAYLYFGTQGLWMEVSIPDQLPSRYVTVTVAMSSENLAYTESDSDVNNPGILVRSLDDWLVQLPQIPIGIDNGQQQGEIKDPIDIPDLSDDHQGDIGKPEIFANIPITFTEPYPTYQLKVGNDYQFDFLSTSDSSGFEVNVFFNDCPQIEVKLRMIKNDSFPLNTEIELVPHTRIMSYKTFSFWVNNANGMYRLSIGPGGLTFYVARRPTTTAIYITVPLNADGWDESKNSGSFTEEDATIYVRSLDDWFTISA